MPSASIQSSDRLPVTSENDVRSCNVVADVRLNPILEKHCHDDINKLCADELNQLKPGKESGGKVLLCLRQQYVKKVRQFFCTSNCFSDLIIHVL